MKTKLVFHPVWRLSQPHRHKASAQALFYRAGFLRFCYILESKYHLVAHFVDLIKEGSTGIDSVEAFALEEIKRRKKQARADRREKKKLPSDTSYSLHSLCNEPGLPRSIVNEKKSLVPNFQSVWTHTHIHTLHKHIKAVHTYSFKTMGVSSYEK